MKIITVALGVLLSLTIAFGGARAEDRARALDGRKSMTDQAANFMRGEALYQDIVTYCGFGDHRTATEADLKTAEWLAGRLTECGVAAELHPYRLSQFFPEGYGLTVDGRAVDSFPLWPPRTTGPEPLKAPLALPPKNPAAGGLQGKIALVEVPVRGASVTPRTGHVEIVQALVSAGAVGIVAITPSPMGELVALNSMRGPEPWPVPILLVGSKDAPTLTEAAKRGAPAELFIEGRYEADAISHEVVGRLDRGAETIVVSTPYSGWFRCAGERGPGVALFLAVARWAASQNGGPSYVFVASSAHELNALGIRHFVREQAPPPERVKSWLHLGAGIATYEYEASSGEVRRLNRPSRLRRLMTNDPALAPLLEKHFGEMPGLKPIVSDRPGGEMVLMAHMGYKVWGFAGASAFHHLPGDVPERITGPELLEPVGRSIIEVLKVLARQ